MRPARVHELRQVRERPAHRRDLAPRQGMQVLPCVWAERVQGRRLPEAARRTAQLRVRIMRSLSPGHVFEQAVRRHFLYGLWKAVHRLQNLPARVLPRLRMPERLRRLGQCRVPALRSVSRRPLHLGRVPWGRVLADAAELHSLSHMRGGAVFLERLHGQGAEFVSRVQQLQGRMWDGAVHCARVQRDHELGVS